MSLKLKVDKLEGVFETPAALAEQFNSDSADWRGFCHLLTSLYHHVG